MDGAGIMGRIARLCYGTGVSLRAGRLPSLAPAASLLPAEAAQLVRNESAADIWVLGYHGTDGKRAICKEALYGDGDAQ